MAGDLVKFSSSADFLNFVDGNRDAMMKVAPPSFDLDKMKQIVMQSVKQIPALAKCSRDSWQGALLQVAETGLIPGGINKEAYLIPYSGEVQFQISYRGLVRLMKEHGGVMDVEAVCVYEGDLFKVTRGTTPSITHEETGASRAPEKIVAVYGIVTFRNGYKKVDVMYREDVERIRRKSMQADKGPWATDYAEMAKKTVIKRISKLVDISPKVSLFIQREDSRLSTGTLADDWGNQATEVESTEVPGAFQ